MKKITRAEVEEQHKNAIGVYKPPTGTKKPNSKTLAGHIPIVLSPLLNNFLDTNPDNKLLSHWKKIERNQTSCTSKILGRHHGTAKL